VANSETRPFAQFEWMLAGRYLRARSKRGSLSVIALFSFIGIALGVSALIIVMSVMNGFHKELFDKILGLNGHVVIRAKDRDFTDYAAVAERIRAVAGVKNVLPVVEGQVLMTTPATSGVVSVRGIQEADFKAMDAVAKKVFFGTIDGFDKANGIAIGTRLANALGVRHGDEVTMISPRGATTPFGTTPRVKSYPIVAIFEIGMPEFDATIGFLPFEEAQKYFNASGAAHALEVVVDDPNGVDRLRTALTAAAGEGMEITDWRERNATFHNALQVEQSAMFVILSLIILVAALNIISGLIMLVKDKGRDVAILRTMGATRGAVMRVFFVTGASIGIVGTLVGLALGVAFCLNIEHIRQFLYWLTTTQLFPSTVHFLSRLPSQMDTGDVLFVVLMSLSLSIIATLYPSWRAARLDPVEALRYE
jgi:lipoprotein-releasing system permease protein